MFKHNGRPWTKDEDTELRQLYPIHGAKIMAATMARTKGAIHSRAMFLGVTKQRAKIRPGKETIAAVVTIAAHAMGITPARVMSRSRERPAAHARFICYALLRDHRRYSLPGIGQAFGVDHTTVINGLHSIAMRPDLLMKTDAARLYRAQAVAAQQGVY